MSLDQLIEHCKKNDTKAQSDIYKLFSGKLFAICLKYARNRTEAEDGLQDAFITIFKKIDQYKNKGSFEGWLKRITINTVLQGYRKENVLDIVNEEDIEDTTVIINEDTINLDFLLKSIQELPDRYRLVFNLYVLDGYSHKEISQMLKISLGASKSNLSRARLKLKDKIEQYQLDLNSSNYK